jgi:hypothetical protein
MNKQIIVRVIISFIFVAFSLRVLVPVLFNFLKSRIPGQNNQHDIDWMIKKKTESLRAQYGIPTAMSSAVQTKDSSKISTEILKHVSQYYSCTLNESKISSFLEQAEKKKYIHFLSTKNQNSTSHKLNFFSQALLLFLVTEELNKKTFTISQLLARKLSLSLYEFSMGVQIKLLLHMKTENHTEEQVFCDEYVLHTYSEKNITSALEEIMRKEADLWSQSPSLLFEELSLYFHFASIIRPIPQLQNKTDYKTASLILGCMSTDSIDDIKKKYKKLALEKHPDKITAQKLPPQLEKKGIQNFNRIQEAYEVLCLERK